MLAALGLGVFSAEDAEAKKKAKSCAKRCTKKAKKKDWSRKKTKACKDKCNKKAGGGGGPAGFRIISTGDVGEPCTSSATCDTGFCRIIPVVGGTCQLCDPVLVCGTAGNQQCCLVGADCVNGACIG